MALGGYTWQPHDFVSLALKLCFDGDCLKCFCRPESLVSILALGFKRSLSILRSLLAVILLCYLRELPLISIFPGQKDLKSRHNVPSYSVLLLCCLPGNPALVDESHPSQVCVAGVRRKSAGNGGGRERAGLM